VPPAPDAGGQDIHGPFRDATRDVDTDFVVENGDIYDQVTNGRTVYVLDNGDGTYSVVIHEDGAGNRTTRQDPGGTCGAAVGCTTYAYDTADQLSAVTYSDLGPP